MTPAVRTLRLTDRRTPRPGRPDGATDDLHFTDDLVAHFVERCSAPGDLVLDPFAGFGTTPAVAEALGRRGVAIEVLPHRVDAIRQLVPTARILLGDSRRLVELLDEPIDLVVTSPPYMTSIHHPHNPLTGYETMDGDYTTYLSQLASAFSAIAGLLTPTGTVVVNVSDVRLGDHVTPLVADVGAAVARSLALVEDVVLEWDEPSEYFAAEHCLVFAPR